MRLSDFRHREYVNRVLHTTSKHGVLPHSLHRATMMFWGLKPTASQSQIKSAYYQLSKKFHPDVAVDVANAKEKFARLSTAYEVLGSPDKRAVYDRTLCTTMGTTTAHSPYNDIDNEYREFLRRRGSFSPRTGGHASPGTAGRASFDYDAFFRHQYYGMARQNWHARKDFEHRMRQKQAANIQVLRFFIVLAIGLAFGSCFGG